MAEISRADTVPSLLASLGVVAAEEPLPASALDALRWLLFIWSDGHDHVPLFLVHDLGHVLLRGRDLRFTSSRQLPLWFDEERPIRLGYEDRVVARWAIDPSVMEAHVAVAGMPLALRDRAVAHSVTLALSSLLLPLDLPRANPAHVRAVLDSAELRRACESAGALRTGVDEIWRAVTLDLVTRCQPVLAARRLFSDADLWDIAHLHEVQSESARRAVREVHAASERVGPADPGALLALRRAKEVPLDHEQPDAYPTGGFDAISTRGTFENLVRSEVAYVGAGVDVAVKPGERPVDLFDVRFAESELLFYTRDESPLLEERRVMTLIVDRAPELRHKIAELPAQTLVLVLGLCARLQADLVNGLGPSGSFVTIALGRASDTAAEVAVVDEELALLSLSLRAEIAHRRAQLAVAGANPLDVPGRRLVVFSPRIPTPQQLKVPTLRAWIRVGQRTWTQQRAAEPTRVVDPADIHAMRALADALLAET
ncbi:MAG TPA: hypothetical protein VGO62_10760 [Myxococcota bacterium]